MIFQRSGRSLFTEKKCYVVLHKGEYELSLDDIRVIKEEVEPKLLRLPGVTVVDIGYKYVNGKKTDALAIRIYVKKKRDVSEKDAIPKVIKGVPTDVLERGPFVLHSDYKENTNANEKEVEDLQ